MILAGRGYAYDESDEITLPRHLSRRAGVLEPLTKNGVVPMSRTRPPGISRLRASRVETPISARSIFTEVSVKPQTTRPTAIGSISDPN